MQQTRCAQARLIGSRMLQQTGVSMYQQHIGKQACRQVVTSAGAWRPCLALPRRRLPSMRTQPHPMRRTQPSNLPELSTLPLAAPLKAQTSENSSSASAAPASKGAQVTIVGAGPAGLATAIMLARRGYTNITVYERMAEPPAPDDQSVWGDFETTSDRLYMIGLNGRGQTVLRNLDVMDRIDRFSAMVRGRMDWQPGSTQPRKQRYTNRTYVTRCIQRDRLAACLLQEVRERYGDVVRVHFNVECNGVEWRRVEGSEAREVCVLKLAQTAGTSAVVPALVTANASAAAAAGGASHAAAGSSKSSTAVAERLEWAEESDFVIGADGTGSAVRDGMQAASGGRFRVKVYEDTNKLVYRTVPLYVPPPAGASTTDNDAAGIEWDGDLNYSARTKAGVNIDALPTPEGPLVGVVLYKPGCKAIQKVQQDGAGSTEAAAAAGRAFFQQYFPMLLPVLKDADLARFAQKRDSNLPRFSYAGPVLHQGETTCLVGDTIHTVKPFFGQGVNSAFEDIKVLGQALDESDDNIKHAVKRYSELRSKDAEALVTLSHSLDGGFLTFVGPLILDSMLNRMAPWLFSPNIIASLQNEKWSFSGIRARKWVDRAMQVALLGGVAVAAYQLLSRLAQLVLPAVLLLVRRLTTQA